MADYAFEGPSWPSSTITWSFAPAGTVFSNAITGAYQATIRAALARWAQAADLTFVQAADSAAVDIRIGWATISGSEIGQAVFSYLGDTSKPLVFEPGVLLQLEDPAATPLGAALNVFYQGTATTLYQITLHEIGHALGLAHSSNPADVMYAELGPANPDLGAADIQGIQQLYRSIAPTIDPATAPTTIMPATIMPITVAAAPTVTSVFRFFDTVQGTQLLTASTAERDTIVASRPDLTYEGIALGGAMVSSDPDAVPVFRFFDTTNGTHFFTSSQAEADTLATTRPDLVPEATSFFEHAIAQPGDTPVYRFFEQTNGTHFYTSSDTERASILSTRPDLLFEGVAFYAPQPS